MNKNLFLMAAFLFLFGCVFAGSVSRSFSSATVQPGADLAVTLAAGIDAGETFYIIDELLPSGWAIKDAGTAATEHTGHLKWVVISNAANTTYNYTLTAPSQEGTAAFSGTCMFEGMASEAQIGGQNQVNIVSGNAAVDGTTNYLLAAIAALVVIAIAVALIMANRAPSKKKK